MRLTSLFFAVVSLAACRFDGNGVDLDAGEPSDASADGAIDAGGDCTPAEQTCLTDDTLRSCESGTFVDRKCPLGCLSTPGIAHCALPVPSNMVDPAWAEDPDVVADLVILTGETFVFETHTGRLQKCGGGEFHDTNVGVKNGINYQQLPAQGQPTLGVLALSSLSIQPGGTLRVIGDAAGALLVRNDLTIAGTLDLSGGSRACDLGAACDQPKELWCAGPGGGQGGVGAAPGPASAGAPGEGPGGGGGGTFGGVGIDELGGAGAGFGGMGGAPGGITLVTGGTSYGTLELEPLVAGSGGGAGGFSSGSGGDGGGGAGAVQLTAGISITVETGGVILAGGGGGGQATGAQGNGGGGGGSGGAVLLEAPAVHIDGIVAANGGGGGGGGDPSKPGQNGQASAIAAAGGEGFNATRNGGNGGAGALAGGSTGNPVGVTGDGTGGGGGAVGRIFLRALPSGIEVGSGVLSPSPGQGMLKTQ